ncbi:uncharacterized protein LOC111643799 [Copidosoma floridanum]|uniref:uncharacterized protein LOC111643799 n=1 Tax=Copidosoma floridanum TaxID=29053 RepID=UPI000C6F4677|nr:uncharacterized protein LOC111643799 [Copidosoma floridanum]
MLQVCLALVERKPLDIKVDENIKKNLPPLRRCVTLPDTSSTFHTSNHFGFSEVGNLIACTPALRRRRQNDKSVEVLSDLNLRYQQYKRNELRPTSDLLLNSHSRGVPSYLLGEVIRQPIESSDDTENSDGHMCSQQTQQLPPPPPPTAPPPHSSENDARVSRKNLLLQKIVL